MSYVWQGTDKVKQFIWGGIRGETFQTSAFQNDAFQIVYVLYFWKSTEMAAQYVWQPSESSKQYIWQ